MGKDVSGKENEDELMQRDESVTARTKKKTVGIQDVLAAQERWGVKAR